MKTAVIIVCGGRFYGHADPKSTRADKYERAALQKAEGIKGLDDLYASRLAGYTVTVIEGGATGADAIGNGWATAKGLRVQSYKAQWSRFGNGAGRVRNKLMRDVLLAVPAALKLVVSMPGGTGTGHMREIASEANIEVVLIGTSK